MYERFFGSMETEGGVRYLMSVRAHGNAECARKAKIGQLQVIPLVNEEVLRLEVTMQDPVRVAIP